MIDLAPAPFHADLAEGSHKATAYWVQTRDKLRLRTVYWRAEREKATILLLSGRSEYAEKFGRAVGDYLKRGFSVITLDWRGQGLSDRLLADPLKGHVAKFSDYQRDLAALLAAAHTLGLSDRYLMIAHSMGGCIGLRHLMDGSPVRAAVFTGPMWGILLPSVPVPVARVIGSLGVGLGLGNTYAPTTKGECYVVTAAFENNTLTTDPDMWAYMQRQLRTVPALQLGGPSLNWLHQALVEMDGLAARPAPTVPAITFVGDNERIVDIARMEHRMEHWPGGTLSMIDNAEHELLMERAEVRSDVAGRACDLFDEALAV